MLISFINLNAKGLRNSVKRKALFLFVENHGSDFCFFKKPVPHKTMLHFGGLSGAVMYGCLTAQSDQQVSPL